MVYVILPIDSKALPSFLYTGVAPAMSRFAVSPADGADRAFVSCGNELIGPFDIVGKGSGTVSCKISEPIRRMQHQPVDVPTRIADSMASKLLGGAEAIPKYEGVTGDSVADGLLASAEDGIIRFESDNWDVVRHYSDVLDKAGISHSLASSSEISVDDKGLCGRCASIPEDLRVSDDGFMSGFLATKVRSGRIYGCPDWAKRAFGSRVLVASDPYGNPAVSKMSSSIYPFGILVAEGVDSAEDKVPESFRFAAAETVYVTALDLSGYKATRIWGDSLTSMYKAERSGESYKVIIMRKLCDESVSQLRNRPCYFDAVAVALDPGIMAAPYGKVKPLLDVKGFDWSVADGIFSEEDACGPRISGPVLEEAEHFLRIIWDS